MLAASFLVPENLGKSGAPFSYRFEEAYQRDGDWESLPLMREVKTLFLTESSLQLVQFWSGRLQFNGFTSTLHMQNVQFGPSAAGGLQDFRSAPKLSRRAAIGRSLRRQPELYFGQDAHIRRPTQIWRRLAQIVSAVQ